MKHLFQRVSNRCSSLFKTHSCNYWLR